MIEIYGPDIPINNVTLEDIESATLEAEKYWNLSNSKKGSKYFAICKSKNEKKWRICIEGNYYMSSENEIEAALMANEVLLELYGYKARQKINIITPEQYQSLWDHPDEENLKNSL
jgi:hypothetical protein